MHGRVRELVADGRDGLDGAGGPGDVGIGVIVQTLDAIGGRAIGEGDGCVAGVADGVGGGLRGGTAGVAGGTGGDEGGFGDVVGGCSAGWIGVLGVDGP